jgi:hypothetical protein
MTQYRIIGGDQKEYGPATADELRQWIAEGRANGQTRTRVEGSNEWQPLSSFAEFAEALRAQSAHAPPSVGVPPLMSSERLTAQVLANRPQLLIGRYLALSWNLLKANPGLILGSTALLLLIRLGCNLVPFLGPIAYLLIGGVLYGGLAWILLKRIRGQPAEVGDLFAGFNLAFVQLMLVGVVSSVLSWVGALFCLLPGLYLFVAWVFSIPLVVDKRLEFWSAMELSRKAVTRVWFEVFGLLVVAFLPFVLIYILAEIKISAGTFALMQGLMNSGQPDFARLFASLSQMIKTSLPLVMLIRICFFLNLPFALGALLYAYEDLFGTRATPGS